MTKFGFMTQGSVVDRSPAKRRKSRVSRNSVMMRGSLVNVIDKDGNLLRKVAVSQKGRRFSIFAGIQRTAASSRTAASTSVQKIKSISAEDSAELSFRMLNTLDARMKEEDFDAFE